MERHNTISSGTNRERSKMKLRNKKTGEIKDWDFGSWYQTILNPENKEKYECKLNDFIDRTVKFREEWEDAPEEPKKHYEILSMGAVMEREDAEDEIFRNQGQKEIGNYFETKEEAEKAVEKLKALANLRKRGLKFNGWNSADRGLVGEFEIYCDALNLDGIEQELELVFGREEI